MRASFRQRTEGPTKKRKKGRGTGKRAQGNATEVNTITQIAKAFVAVTVARKKRKHLVVCIEREIKSKGRKEDENQRNKLMKLENAKEISTKMM